MALYRSKSWTVEATQWFPGKEVTGVQHFPKSERVSEFYAVETIHGQLAFLDPGDWVVTEPDGVHYYPIKSDIFAKRYELIE